MDKMNEPKKKSQAVLDATRQLQETASQNGHALGEWKWNDCNSWRACCENRNCIASVWVTPSGEVGGSIGGECWIRTFNKSLGRETS